jgi:hypothetical protein
MEGRERFHGAESACGDRERTKHEHALKRDLTPHAGTDRGDQGGRTAMISQVTTALQVNATTGNGETLVLREPRLVTVSSKSSV